MSKKERLGTAIRIQAGATGPFGEIKPSSYGDWTGVPASYNHAISSLMFTESYGVPGAHDDVKDH
jgi:hypothetical protein